MVARQAIDMAIREADARLDRLLPLMETYADAKLLDDGGKWSIKDCLSHVAGSARVTGGAHRVLDRAAGKPQPPAPTGTVDERNAHQVAEHSHLTVVQLIEEAKKNHAHALEDLKAIDEPTLMKKFPGMQPNAPEQTIGGMIMRSLEYHEGRQLDRIEDALKARTRWL